MRYIGAMKQILSLTFAASLAAAPVIAEESKGTSSLMEEGAKLLLRGFMQEMEPAIDDLKKFSEEVEPGLRKFVQQMGPVLTELMGKIDDFTAYHPPEVLPNGDIIIRRKTPDEIKKDKADSGEIEL